MKYLMIFLVSFALSGCYKNTYEAVVKKKDLCESLGGEVSIIPNDKGGTGVKAVYCKIDGVQWWVTSNGKLI